MAEDVFQDSVKIEIQTREKGSQSANSIERTIHSLRQLYALLYALDRHDEESIPNLNSAIKSNDLEAYLVPPDEWLRFEEIALGSFAAVLTAIGKKWKSVLSLGLLLYPKGRENVDRRVEATTKLQELDVEAKQLHIEREKIKLELEELKLQKERMAARAKQLDVLMKYDAKIAKIKDPQKRQLYRLEFDSHLSELNVVRGGSGSVNGQLASLPHAAAAEAAVAPGSSYGTAAAAEPR